MAEKDKKAFTGGVDKAQADFNKALTSAKNVLSDAKKQGNKEVAAVARGLINQLNTVAKPALEILQKTQNPNAGYTGNVTPINQALAGGAPGSGPSGAVLGTGGSTGGSGSYTLGQIRAYMDANSGAFPPDLNTIASGITASDLGNLQNQYNIGQGSSGTGTGLKTNTNLPDAATSRSAYDLVTSELTRLGLSSLITPLRNLFESGISEGESLRLALSQTPEYQTRFSANAKRIGAGLSALSPAEYIQLEDQYQNVMRNYGLPASYYAKDATGKQIGFDELLGGDVSATELEERLITAQDRVLKSNPEVLDALKKFYPGIEKGDILAYSLDPKNALKDIQRKVAAAEIGGAALAQGLSTTMAGSEELAGYGVTKAQAQQGFADVAQMAPRGSALSEIYNEAPYNQATATAEVFGTSGAAEATQKRKKLTALEQATFGGQSGLAQGALARNSGAGAF